MNILIAGDFVPQDRTLKYLKEHKYECLFGQVAKHVKSCDYSLVNLEAPIVLERGQPIKKCGPNLKAPLEVIDAIRYAGFNGVTLANNHFYDYGEVGVSDTIQSLKNTNIDYVGAGFNLNEAGRVLYKDICGKIVAFINSCEHEYSIATDTTGGSNPLNPIKIYKSIHEAKRRADYVIVIVHGGIEGYQLPTPRMQDTYRFFIEVGADAVVNHHQHCYSGYEYYMDKPIFYGLGNFCFDWKGKRHSIWNEGLMLKLSFDDYGIKHELIPYIQDDDDLGVILMTNEKAKDFNQSIQRLNAIISNSAELKNEHEKYMIETARSQRYAFCPFTNKYLAALYVRCFIPELFPKSKLRTLQNKIMCESHRERILFYLSTKLK